MCNLMLYIDLFKTRFVQPEMLLLLPGITGTTALYGKLIMRLEKHQ